MLYVYVCTYVNCMHMHEPHGSILNQASIRIYAYAHVRLLRCLYSIPSHAILCYVYIHIVYIVGMSIVIMVIRIINIVLHSYLMYNMYLFIVYTYIHCSCNHSIIETCTAVDGTLCVGRSRNVLMTTVWHKRIALPILQSHMRWYTCSERQQVRTQG